MSQADQGRPSLVNGFGYVTNKHQHDWNMFHRIAWNQRQALLTDMDPKMRDPKVMLDERSAFERDADNFDQPREREMEKRAAIAINYETGWRRDVQREEFIHEDIYFER